MKRKRDVVSLKVRKEDRWRTIECLFTVVEERDKLEEWKGNDACKT